MFGKIRLEWFCCGAILCLSSCRQHNVILPRCKSKRCCGLHKAHFAEHLWLSLHCPICSDGPSLPICASDSILCACNGCRWQQSWCLLERRPGHKSFVGGPWLPWLSWWRIEASELTLDVLHGSMLDHSVCLHFQNNILIHRHWRTSCNCKQYLYPQSCKKLSTFLQTWNL